MDQGPISLVLLTRIWLRKSSRIFTFFHGKIESYESVSPILRTALISSGHRADKVLKKGFRHFIHSGMVRICAALLGCFNLSWERRGKIWKESGTGSSCLRFWSSTSWKERRSGTLWIFVLQGTADLLIPAETMQMSVLKPTTVHLWKKRTFMTFWCLAIFNNEANLDLQRKLWVSIFTTPV